MSLPNLENFDVKNKKVLVLTDLGLAEDSESSLIIDSILPTIELLSSRGASIVIGSHIGDPKQANGKTKSLKNSTLLLEKALNKTIPLVEETPAQTGKRISELNSGDIIVLENLLRFRGELKKEVEFAKTVASWVDLFVNDAFDASQHHYATTTLLPKHVAQSAAGINLFKEYHATMDLLSLSKKPLMLILGGVDVQAKMELIKNLKKNLSYILIGGGLPYTFLKSRAIPTGNSLVEFSLQVDAFQLMEKAELNSVNFHLPSDHVVAEQLTQNASTKVVGKMDIPPSWKALDIGPKTVDAYAKLAKKAGSIFWYGPMGAVEIDKFAAGTQSLAKALGKLKSHIVIAGRSCTDAVLAGGELKNRPHFSTSSSATLRLLKGEEMPGIEALKK